MRRFDRVRRLLVIHNSIHVREQTNVNKVHSNGSKQVIILCDDDNNSSI